MSAQTARPVLKKIQCPNCGSPVSQYTPDAQTLVCGSCGAHIGFSIDGPQLTGKGRKLPAPPVPIEIGEVFTMENTTYFVMGRVLYEGWDDEDKWRWNEWLLGTNDGRLLWLSYDENGFTLYKKLRNKLPFNAAIDTALPIGEGKNVRVHERYPARILGAEGELTWKADVGERFQVAEAAGHGKRYSVQQTTEELEVHEGDALDETAVAQSFNDAGWLAKIKQRVSSTALWRTVGIVCILFALMGLVGVGLAGNLGEQTISQSVTLSRANPLVQFPVEFNVANRPAEIRVSAQTTLPENTSIDLNASVISPNENRNELFTLELYHETGFDDEGAWREQRTAANNMFVPTIAGLHTFELQLGEGQLDTMQVEVSIQRNRMITFWLLVYSVVVAIIGIVLIFVNSRSLRQGASG